MKARIRRSETILDYNYKDLEKAEKSMIDTWEEFRKELIKPDFKYDDIEKAKKIKFLRAFDNLFNLASNESKVFSNCLSLAPALILAASTSSNVLS